MQIGLSLNSENLLPKHGSVVILMDFLEYDFHALRESIDWKHQAIKMFGRSVMQPRLTAWFGDEGTEYSYSGLMNYPLPWNSELLEIKKRVEELSQAKFNSVLLNLYRNGQDSMGWHQDNEVELGVNPTIASVSFGATRQFQMRHKFDKSIPKIDIGLQDGSVLIMSDVTQKYWQHQITKTKKVVGERINLTFRTITKAN